MIGLSQQDSGGDWASGRLEAAIVGQGLKLCLCFLTAGLSVFYTAEVERIDSGVPREVCGYDLLFEYAGLPTLMPFLFVCRVGSASN